MPTKKPVKAAPKRAVAKAKPKLSVKSKPTPKPTGPPPPRADSVTMSGIYKAVQVSESDPNQELREIFGHYDRDEDGLIELPEFARICEASGMTMEEDELATGYAIVDADGDGKISWEEFKAWWRSLGR